MAISFSAALSQRPLHQVSIVTFIVCMLVLIADGMDAQLLGIVAPKVIEEFGIDRGTFGIAMSAALVGFGLGSWSGGWLGDMVGRRWSLALAAVVFALSTVGASTAADVWQMAAWRLVGGLGFGSAYANAIALAGEWLPDKWRSVGVTTLSVGTPAGGLVVAALAPELVETYAWRGSFVVVGFATLLVVVLIVAFLRDSPSFLLARGKVDEARAVARKVLPHDVEIGPESHHSDRAGATIGVFDPINLRLNIGVGISFAASTMCAYGILNWTTTMLSAKAFTFEQASYAVSVGGLTSIASSIAAGVLVQQFGSRIVFAAISAALTLTMLVLAFELEALTGMPDENDRLLIFVLIGVVAALFSGGIASLYALMTHAYPPSCRSGGIGFGIFVGRIGAIAASGLGGWLLDVGQGSVVPFFAVLCVSAALVSAAAFVVDRPVPPARAPRGVR